VVDSRSKGMRAEYLVRDLLRAQTGLEFQRVPQSGALAYLKGDIYLPDRQNKYCWEIKHYKEDNITSNLFNVSVSNLEKWWLQAAREAEVMKNEPLLVFRKDRGKWLVGTLEPVEAPVELVLTTEAIEDTIYIYLFSVWLEQQSEETLCV